MTTSAEPVATEAPSLSYTTTDTALGRILLAASARGLVLLRFLEEGEDAVAALAQILPTKTAALASEGARVRSWAEAVARFLNGQGPRPDLPLDVSGSPFQMKVWAALRRIPAGKTVTYGDLAREIGKPGAARAVGMANARNPVAIVVPCHLVTAARGSLGGYAFGFDRKRRLLALEKAALQLA